MIMFTFTSYCVDNHDAYHIIHMLGNSQLCGGLP